MAVDSGLLTEQGSPKLGVGIVAMATKRVQCFARGVPGDWEATCVDLDIAVQGRSFEEVKSLLDEAVHSYVEDACAEDPETARALLNRRAPLPVRVRLAGSYLVHLLTRKDGDREYKAGFDLPCHA